MKYSPTGPSWDTVCMLKDISFSGSLWSSFLIAKALAIILLFLILLGSLSLRPMILPQEKNKTKQVTVRWKQHLAQWEGDSDGYKSCMRMFNASHVTLGRKPFPTCKLKNNNFKNYWVKLAEEFLGVDSKSQFKLVSTFTKSGIKTTKSSIRTGDKQAYWMH